MTKRGLKKYVGKPVTVYYETAEGGGREYMGGMMVGLDDDELILKYFDNIAWEWRQVGINLHGNIITKVIVATKFMDKTSDPQL